MGMSFQDTITVGSVHIKDVSVPQCHTKVLCFSSKSTCNFQLLTATNRS